MATGFPQSEQGRKYECLTHSVFYDLILQVTRLHFHQFYWSQRPKWYKIEGDCSRVGVLGSGDHWRPSWRLTTILNEWIKISFRKCVAAFQGRTGSHRIWADVRKFTELLGCLTCLYARVGQSTHTTSPVSRQQGVPTPLYIKCTQNWQGAKILYNKAWFCACGPIFKVMGILRILVTQTSAWGSLTEAISPTGNSNALFICFPWGGSP